MKLPAKDAQAYFFYRQIIGVLNPDFKFMDDLGKPDGDVWVPLEQNPFQTRGRNVRYLNAVARLNPGVSLQRAQAEMTTIAGRLERQYPDSNTGFGIETVQLHEEVAGKARSFLVVLLGAVGFVLLIACANVANLLLMRGEGRRRELAVDLLAALSDRPEGSH